MILGSTASQLLKIQPTDRWVHCYTRTVLYYSDPRQERGYHDINIHTYFAATGDTPTEGLPPDAKPEGLVI